MPTTPDGTTYTPEYLMTSDGLRARWFMDDARDTASNVPTVVFVHGSGGDTESLSYIGWDPIRNYLVDSGWAVVEADGGGSQNWGGPTARTVYQEAFDWLVGKIDVGSVVVLGQSMGGICSYWLATQSSFAARVVGLVVQNGTTDLAYRYDIAAESTVRAMNIAYGLGNSTVKDIPAFTLATVGYDPMLFDTELWASKLVLQNWSLADTQVPPGPNGQAWVAAYGPYTAETGVNENSVGGHRVTSQDSAATIAFLAGITATPEPPAPQRPGEFFIARDTYLVGADLRLYGLTAVT